MQGYKEIALTDIARDAVMQLQENIKTIATNNAGTSFPTTNLYDGLMCYRTDEKRQYVYNASSKKWEAIEVSNADQAIKASQDGQGNTISTTYAKAASLAKVATSGSYNDLSDKPDANVLPIASTSTLGGVKIGSDLSIASDGVLSVSHAASADTTTTATSATKATQDGQGNTISTTYAPKASPTFTGAVTASNLTVTTSLIIPGGKIYIE